MKVFVVIPTIRTLSFLFSWKNQFRNCYLIIVEDHAEAQIEKPDIACLGVTTYTWKDITHDFGKDEWIFSRQNAGIRSYGFWKAFGAGAEIIITLDDDCFPVGTDFVKQHEKNLTLLAPEKWCPTFPHPDYLYTRGFPYDIRNTYQVALSHGLWSNKMDMDAKTQVKTGDINVPAYPPLCQFIPFGSFFPMSSMNLAFRRELVPCMYFPLMGSDQHGNAWGFDRFDDIWAGIFAKKIMDHLQLVAVNGSPFVEHKKASDVQTNLIKEKSGIEVNETLWRAVDQVCLTQKSPGACYKELATTVVFPKTPYFERLRRAMIIWAELFS